MIRNGVNYTMFVPDVAAEYQYSEGHIRLLASQGKLPYLRRGRRYMFAKEIIDPILLKLSGDEAESVEEEALNNGLREGNNNTVQPDGVIKPDGVVEPIDFDSVLDGI